MELMVVILLLSVLFVAAIPLSTSFSKRNQLSLRKNEIIAAIHYARNQSVKVKQNLLLVSTSGTSDWSKGMFLIIDKHHTGTYSAGDTIVQSWKWRNNGIKVKWNGFRSNHYIDFQPRLKSLASSGHFTIKDKSNAVVETVTLNRFARVLEG